MIFNYILMMIIGHFIGDYLFQTSEMAREKNKLGIEGWYWALVHGGVYTLCIILWMLFSIPTLNVYNGYFVGFILFTWLTHSTIDHYSLAKKWSKFMKSDTLPDFNKIERDAQEIWRTVEIYKISFTSFVYIVVDNTWHIVLQSLYLIIFGDKF